MILNSLQNGPLVWPTVVEEDGTTRTRKYKELSVVEKLQADCDLKATNIVLQGLPPDVHAIIAYGCILERDVTITVSEPGTTHYVVSVSFAKHISISPILLNYTLLISTPMKSLKIIDHEYQNCPLRFDDKISSANMFPLDMNDFDIKF
nr:reverse transcriptase domain-containing protein [Tanacetum cinerariifolium]